VDSPIAPGMGGYTPESSPRSNTTRRKAKALLDMFGYVDRDGDGWRDMPDGSALVIDQASGAEQRARPEERAVAPQHGGDRRAHDVRQGGEDARAAAPGAARQDPVDDLRLDRRLSRRRELPAALLGQIDRRRELHALRPSEYNRMYERIKSMPDSPERTEIYRRMVRLVWVYNPWRVNSLMRNTVLIHPWVIGYKKHPFAHEPFRYLDIDLEKLKAGTR
jgi:hypothetical protein